MASNRSYTVIGAFLLGALILLTGAVLAFGNTGLFKQQRQAIIFFNQSVLGLTHGSRVLFRGVQVGTVRKVQLRLAPGGGDARIAVKIDMSGDDVVSLNGTQASNELTIQEMVKRGLRAQLVVYSYVTSQLAVNLDFKPNSKPNFVVDPDKLERPEIPAVPSEISQLKDTVAEIPWQKTLKSVDDAVHQMVSLAQDMDRTVNTLGPSLAQTSDDTQQTLKTVQQAIKQNNAQLQATIKSVRTLSDNANDAVVTHDQQIDKLLTSAQKTSDNLATLSRNLKNVSDPDSGTRQDIDASLRDLSAAMTSLRQFADTIKRDPHTLLYGSPDR